MKCTTIKTAATITRAESEREKELLSLINGIQVPSVNWKAGDICFYDSGSASLKIIDFDKWSAAPSAYPSSRYTPIGVVVIPSSHDVYGTGECAVVSLKEMSCATPDEGSTSSTTMYWGQKGVDTELHNFYTAAHVGTCDAPGSEVVGTNSTIYMPSDNFSATACPTDPDAFYYYDDSSHYAAPSPYSTDGSRNPAYYQTESPSSANNVFADFDGAGNTEVLCGIATAQADWKTDGTITDDSGEGYSPAACCCWRYHTDGTAQGDWYLPAGGEAGYIVARVRKLNETITALIAEYGDTIGATFRAAGYSSSSEASASNFHRVYTDVGHAGYSSRETSMKARAFLRV